MNYPIEGNPEVHRQIMNDLEDEIEHDPNDYEDYNAKDYE